MPLEGGHGSRGLRRIIMQDDNTMPRPRIGLILTGGGARAAYQVGVLRALSELLPKDAQTPFPIICGTSAGSINEIGRAHV